MRKVPRNGLEQGLNPWGALGLGVRFFYLPPILIFLYLISSVPASPEVPHSRFWKAPVDSTGSYWTR